MLGRVRRCTPLPLRRDFSGTNIRMNSIGRPTANTLLYLSIARRIISRTVRVKYGLVISRRPLTFGTFGSLANSACVRQYVVGTYGCSLIVCTTRAGLSGTTKNIGFHLTRLVKLRGIHILDPRGNTLLGLIAFIPRTCTSLIEAALFGTKTKTVNNCSSYDFDLPKDKAFHTNRKAGPFYNRVNRLRIRPRVHVRAVLPTFHGSAIAHTLLSIRPCRRPMFSFCPLSGT